MDFVEACASSLNATSEIASRNVTRFIECNLMYILTLNLTLFDHENCNVLSSNFLHGRKCYMFATAEKRDKKSKETISIVRVLRKLAECVSYKHRCNANDKCSHVFNLLTLMDVAFNNNISQRYFECTSVRSLSNVLPCNIPGR
jgi:hypothetical protein